jgi:quercetin dioxygenase-like cupin family protein
MRTTKLVKTGLISAATAALFIFGGAIGDPMSIVNPSSGLQSCGPDAPPGCQHLVLQGDPKTGPSQRVYHFPAGFAFVKHWHASNENVVITKGTLKIAADGQSERILNVGDYLYIPAKVVHWGGCPQECEFYLMEDGPTSFNAVEKN